MLFTIYFNSLKEIFYLSVSTEATDYFSKGNSATTNDTWTNWSLQRNLNPEPTIDRRVYKILSAWKPVKFTESCLREAHLAGGEMRRLPTLQKLFPLLSKKNQFDRVVKKVQKVPNFLGDLQLNLYKLQFSWVRTLELE